MTVKISDSKFVYSGKSYFRGGCEDVNLVSYGEKKTPINRPNYLYLAGTVPADTLAKVDPDVSGPFPIEWSKFSDTDVNVGISVGMVLLFMTVCIAGITYIFRTGYRLKA